MCAGGDRDAAAARDVQRPRASVADLESRTIDGPRSAGPSTVAKLPKLSWPWLMLALTLLTEPPWVTYNSP